jgi:hypothetical protein
MVAWALLKLSLAKKGLVSRSALNQADWSAYFTEVSSAS